MSGRKKKSQGCDAPLLSKKDKKRLIGLVNSLNVCNEDSVFDVGVELGRWSVKLRSIVLSKDEEC